MLVTAGVVAVIVVALGDGERRPRGLVAPLATATSTPTLSNASEPCAGQAPTPAETIAGPTVFDKLSDGASTDDPDFEASFAASMGNNSPQSPADLTLDMNVRSGDVAPVAFYILIPAEWGITPGCQIPIGLSVGTLRWDALLGRDGGPCNQPGPLLFTMLNASTDPSDTVDFLDGDENGTPDFAEDKDSSGRADVFEKYPDFLNRLFPDRTPVRRSAGIFTYSNPPVLAQSLVFDSLDGSENKTLVIVVQNLGDPEAVAGESGFSDYCTPFGFRMTDFGTDQSGAPFYTNPPAGEYAFILTAFGGRDADGDGIENGLDTCPFDVNVGNPRVGGEGDADEDGLDAACDPNDFERDLDQDSDGYLNRDDICPLARGEDSSTQKDSDGDQIGDECDTSGNGPIVADGQVPTVLRSSEVAIQ